MIGEPQNANMLARADYGLQWDLGAASADQHQPEVMPVLFVNDPIWDDGGNLGWPALPPNAIIGSYPSGTTAWTFGDYEVETSVRSFSEPTPPICG